ncbi:MAG: response regulator receiver [Hyphomicrobiales bacterium]|nr:response regulator receiver [Hyphomicrobiales bacterium]
MFSSLSVLLVEDDPAFLEAAKLMLARIGFGRIEAVSDAESAREQLALMRYDMILSDWNMEPTSGFDLLVHVRGEHRLVPTPFILMTANLSEDYWVAALQAGASDFLRKPFSFRALRDSVHMVLEPRVAMGVGVVVLRSPRAATG